MKDTEEILKEKIEYIQDLLKIETLVKEMYTINPDIYDMMDSIKDMYNLNVHYDNEDSKIIICVTHKQEAMHFSQPSLHIYIEGGQISTNRGEIESCLEGIKKFE